ncbi:Ndj1p [Saccharomyces paradoxus]|uniref:Ndj1p n=1 Tax=Saccharomyces paradoxus TaxID=27291 RepID=A0A8B8UZ60_SACPA|nr:Ndj1 [Saccharomyces paradoxus]QHS76022.1 Ndj1 [Saccharomyces paradoxus]
MSKDKRLASISLQPVASSCGNCTEVQDLKLHNLRVELDCLPLKGFMSNICPPTFRDHKSYVFVLYCLNQVDLVTELRDSTKCHHPLQIFKDCQLISLVQKDFVHYFQFRRNKEGDNRSDSDTTLVNVANSKGSCYNSQLLRMSIIPRICSFDKPNSKTYKLILEYANRFETVLTKFGPEKDFTKIYANWSKLIESFNELILQDLLAKWQQWLELTQPDTTVHLSIPNVLTKLAMKLTQKYFTFQHSCNCSVDEFTTILLDKNSLSLFDVFRETRNYELNFGLWLDSQNGILIFTNGIVHMSDKITSERLKSFVRPAHLLVLEDHSNDEIVKKLMFFIFSAILQCFTDEIPNC